MFEDDEQIPSKTYKVVHHRIVGFTDDLDAVEQAVDKILQTERFQYEIYSESYGHDLIDLIGQDFDLAFSEIERLIVEVLTADDRIDGIENLVLNKISKDSLMATFTVSTIFGEIKAEREVAV